jgi:hypothetical protein
VKKRRNAFDFTACLAHVEVTVIAATQEVLRVRGYFEHNEACQKSVIARMPELQIHPSVYIVALAQLKEGVSPAEVREKNKKLFKARAYKDQPKDLQSSSYRWLLRQTDFRTIYRQHSRLLGVNATAAPHLNVDEWLTPGSPQYNPMLADAVFHYSARTAKEERFEVCIATKEMREASWLYGHKSQIILDGTFGLCDKRLLLFIVMGLDEERRGVPLAFLLFSAPTGNRQTSAGYNTDIITQLLRKWRESLGKRDGEVFIPLVAITDTDLIERAALLRVFPHIWLLICKFHLRQSWRNHRNRELKGKSQPFLDTKSHLRRLEESLVKTTTIDEARAAIQREREWLEGLAESDPRLAEKGMVHIDYLLNYWTTDALWKSWSDCGRHIASKLLGCSFEGVLPTTNHLESFNGLLKNKHLHRWQRSGRRLRVDMLLKSLITTILPSIFEQRKLEKAEQNRIDELIRAVPGGSEVLVSRSAKFPATLHCYLHIDESRDAAAEQLIKNNQVGAPTFNAGENGLRLQCYSALAFENDPMPQIYSIWLGFDGMAHCDCLDFTSRGGACKHIRGSLIRIQNIRSTGVPIPDIPLPTSEIEARARQFTTAACRAACVSQSSLIPSQPETEMQKEGPVMKAAHHVDDLLADTDEFFEENQGKSDGEEDVGMDSDAESVGTNASDEPHHIDLPIDFVPDNESVATDASSDDYDFGSMATYPVNASKSALNDQAITRVFYDLENAQLSNLEVFLDGITINPENIPRAIDFYDHLTSLAKRLKQTIDESASTSITAGPSTVLVNTQISTGFPSFPPSQLGKRSRTGSHSTPTGILPPSPEKRQKRKKSYGIH